MATGVYCIRNLITGEFYIGSAAGSFDRRWNEHRHSLRTGRHHNFRLQAAWRFYGESSFRFAVVEECSPERCIEREQWLIDVFMPEYNVCRVAGSVLGRTVSPATRAKISATLHGHTVSSETRAKIRERGILRMQRSGELAKLSAMNKGNKYRLGHKHTPEAIAKMRAASTGNKYGLGHHLSLEARAKIGAASYLRRASSATRAKMSASHKGNQYCLGYKHSPATRAKLSAILKGNKHNLGHHATTETRTKMSIAQKALIRSQESLAQITKLGIDNRGKKLSAEHRAALKAAWVRRKERCLISSSPLSSPSTPPVAPAAPV